MIPIRTFAALTLALSLAGCGGMLANSGGGGGGAPAGGNHEGKAAPEWWHSTVTLTNTSGFAIHHIFLTPANETQWGPDQLGDDTLESEESVKFSGIECDTYDLRLIDESGDECIVQDIDLCLEDAQWNLTTEALAACQGWGA